MTEPARAAALLPTDRGAIGERLQRIAAMAAQRTAIPVKLRDFASGATYETVREIGGWNGKDGQNRDLVCCWGAGALPVIAEIQGYRPGVVWLRCTCQCGQKWSRRNESGEIRDYKMPTYLDVMGTLPPDRADLEEGLDYWLTHGEMMPPKVTPPPPPPAVSPPSYYEAADRDDPDEEARARAFLDAERARHNRDTLFDVAPAPVMTFGDD